MSTRSRSSRFDNIREIPLLDILLEITNEGLACEIASIVEAKNRASVEQRYKAAVALTGLVSQMDCVAKSQYEMGEALLRNAFLLVPEHADVFLENYLAFCTQIADNNLHQRGNYKEGIRYYIKAIELAPQNAELYHDLGIAYVYDGGPIEAMESWHKALYLFNWESEDHQGNIEAILTQNVSAVMDALSSQVTAIEDVDEKHYVQSILHEVLGLLDTAQKKLWTLKGDVLMNSLQPVIQKHRQDLVRLTQSLMM